MLQRMNAKELMTIIAFGTMGLTTASAQITQEQMQTVRHFQFASAPV